MGEYNNIESLNKGGLMPPKLSQAENPYVTAFWKWWPGLYKKLRSFYDRRGDVGFNTFKVLDYVYKNPNAWLEMSVIANMCPYGIDGQIYLTLQKLEEIQIWEGPNVHPTCRNNWYVKRM